MDRRGGHVRPQATSTLFILKIYLCRTFSASGTSAIGRGHIIEAIVGGVSGVLIGLSLVVPLLLYVLRLRRRRRRYAEFGHSENGDEPDIKHDMTAQLVKPVLSRQPVAGGMPVSPAFEAYRHSIHRPNSVGTRDCSSADSQFTSDSKVGLSQLCTPLSNETVKTSGTRQN